MIHDASSRVLVEMIITMCKSLGFKIVAEGIENKAEVLALLKLDCHLGQGYYFSRPLSQIGSGM
jgi:EAL domain-containing protein (putative c-di-GMP-specific phosphodiesterase class I)